ncbi:hypothetical protein Pmob_1245 [Petrotoga mobilis SJ95]|jgi:hypothetical protein|uniref:DUF4351 domain-containing protein n=1 Tax=Petrotoga mobilis (strain DSM 10674 / SJ95) TaxID=403833 RepID=A9BGB1_PETMO|nr:DUF4351 domain-containing protein [Petrotoga mobilis]ABX31961.1 hypothetical protein Pmob_1245 [Petrotoga mobilis SJ95]
MKDTNRTGDIHKDEPAEYHELNFPKIISVKPIDIPVINVSNQNPDFVFELEDNSLLHLEFQTTWKKADLLRFAQYDIALYQKERRRINTVVMYSGKYESAESELDMGSNKYKVQQIFMIKYDGIKRYEEIKEKIEKEEELTDKDLMDLVFLPLMRNEKSEEEVTKDVFELAIKIPDEDKKEAVIGSLLGFSDNYVRDEYINELKEVIRMTKIGTSLFEEGVEEGEKELTIKILNKRFGRRLTEEIKDRIREADKKTIDYIGDNLLEITIEELKGILK